MASHMEGHLLRKSIPFIESWIQELTTAPAVAKNAAASSMAAKAAIPAAPANHGVGGAQPPAAKASNAKPAATGAKPAAAPADADDTPMSRCCFAVGRVIEVKPHPDSTKLYIEKIDLGETLNAMSEGVPRTILSGLQEHVREEDFLNRLVLVIANLEPRKIAGIVSNGMVLCASHNEGERKVVLLDIPAGTNVGERVVFEGHDKPYPPVLKKKLAKSFDEVIAEIRTNEKGRCAGRASRSARAPALSLRHYTTHTCRNGAD